MAFFAPRVCLLGVLALVISWGSLGLELAVSVVSGRGMRDPGLLGLSMGRGGERHMPLAWNTEVPRGVETFPWAHSIHMLSSGAESRRELQAPSVRAKGWGTWLGHPIFLACTPLGLK